MEKQIEEMAKAIHVNCHKGLTKDEAEMIAKWCYQEIERKASEVAEEIFAEIEEIFKAYLESGIYFCELQEMIAKLKKKYTESEDTE